jgi:hypothetical protein
MSPAGWLIVLQGEAASLQNAMTAVADCIERPDGCRVVPGLPIEQYYATLTCSIAGGLVAGFVSKIEPQGVLRVVRVQRGVEEVLHGIWLVAMRPGWVLTGQLVAPARPAISWGGGACEKEASSSTPVPHLLSSNPGPHRNARMCMCC